MHLGGITTGKWATTLEPEGPTLMSWALHNHWMVNFKASQGGEIPLRYRLTTHDGQVDDVAADRFAREQASPLIAIRDLAPSGALSGQFLEVEEGPIEVIHVKPADFGDGIIVRLQNVGDASSSATLRFIDSTPSAVFTTTPDERNVESIELHGSQISLEVSAKQVQSIRVTF
jgi:alpha-mannosidase